MSDQRGYHRLAVLMGKEKSTAIFRRFDDLNMLCLLSLQAEIMQLEKEYRDECYGDDTNGQGKAKQYTSNFKLARDCNSEQHTRLKVIRELLREYNDLLIQVFELGQIDKPLKSQLRSLKEWLDETAFLDDYEVKTWEDNRSRSYVCLEPLGAKADPFTKWLLNNAVKAYDRLLGRHIGSGEVVDHQTGDKSYSSEGVNRASNIITAVLASALPVLAIYVLNGINSTNVRIGVTAAFTVGFAVMMGVFSSAKRSEMIAATATFAAIEVVFIGAAISAETQSTGGQVGNSTMTG